MAGANKFADTGFLIDVFLSGGQAALDALRDKLAGKIYITTDTIDELGRFKKADITALKTWVQNTANVTTINYTDTALAAGVTVTVHLTAASCGMAGQREAALHTRERRQSSSP
jgi:hypothetical protein